MVLRRHYLKITIKTGMDTHQGPFASADNEDLIKLVRTMVSGFQEFSVELKQLHLKTSKLEEKVSLLHDKVWKH